MPHTTPNLRHDPVAAELLNDLADGAVFSSTSGQAFVSIPLGAFHQTFALSDPRFHDWLIDRYYTRAAAPLPGHVLRLIVRTLRARAHCSRRHSIVDVRAAGRIQPAPSVSIDLCNNNGEAIAVSESGWQVTTSPEVVFRSARGQLPLPCPARPGSPAPLAGLPASLAPGSEIWNWAVSALLPSGPYPILILAGPSGSGKSTTARLLRTLLDPAVAPLHPLPSRGPAVLALANRSRILAFDHVTRMSNSVADSLCRVSSGTCISIHEPGDRRETLHLDIARPILLTAGENWKPRPDIASRAVTVRLDPVDPVRRLAPENIQVAFDRACPALQAALYTSLSERLQQIHRGLPPANPDAVPPPDPEPSAPKPYNPTMKPLILTLALAALAFTQPAPQTARRAESASQSALPRPEFPQPQFERDAWLNLNGRWDFDFDDQNVGLTQSWAAGSHHFSRAITIPFCFESKNSGIADASFHPWAWYHREFTIPPAWNGKHILLHFGAVDYRAMVWVNGHLAGRHEGGNVPFTFDITNQLKSGGPDSIVVRAEDPPTDRYIPRGKQYWEPKSHSIFYTRTSGIWQTVWLEPVAASYLESVRITPDMNGIASIYAHVHGSRPGLTLRTTLTYNGTTIATTTTSAAQPRVSTVVSAPEPHHWSPAAPNLYDVTFELLNAADTIDKVHSYFGFRTVAVENGHIALNGSPVYIKMVLDQGYWPDSILTPPSDEAIQYDIKMTKEMGFNGARKHQKLEDPRYLYWADKMGFLVSSEMANAYLFDDESVQRFTREWASAVERDYNHPSIIIWVPINESWGVPNLRDPREQNYLKELYTLTHSLDSTRLVVDNDGWEHTDMTDLFNLHNYARTGELLAKISLPVCTTCGRPALAPGFKYNGSPVLLSEFGGIAFIPPGHEVPAESWGYSGIEKSESAVLDRLRGLYEAIAKTPAIAGICYTQLTDVEQEINGLMTYDRKPKYPAERIREINALLR